jgi:hypothetical protein
VIKHVRHVSGNTNNIFGKKNLHGQEQRETQYLVEYEFTPKWCMVNKECLLNSPCVQECSEKKKSGKMGMKQMVFLHDAAPAYW